VIQPPAKGGANSLIAVVADNAGEIDGFIYSRPPGAAGRRNQRLLLGSAKDSLDAAAFGTLFRPNGKPHGWDRPAVAILRVCIILADHGEPGQEKRTSVERPFRNLPAGKLFAVKKGDNIPATELASAATAWTVPGGGEATNWFQLEAGRHCRSDERPAQTLIEFM